MSENNITRSFTVDGKQFSYYAPSIRTEPGIVWLLAPNMSLVVNNYSGCVTLVDWTSQQFFGQVTFTDEEMPLVYLLIEAWPSAVMYEELLSVFDGVELAAEHKILQLAREKGTLDLLLEPLLEALNTTAEKIKVFKLRVEQEREFGWKLREVQG